MNKKIPFLVPDVGEAEIAEVIDAVKSGWITTGPKVKQLEENLSNFLGVKKTACLASATSAEELNLRILGIGPGDEVIVPAYTYTATASAVVHVGATPIFVDIDSNGSQRTHSPEVSQAAIERAITDKTKAIIAVDIAGIPCDYDKIKDVASEKKNLFTPSNPIQEAIGRVAVLADAAHSLGSAYHNKMTGAIADMTSFSFHAVKNFTTGEGGASTWNIPGVNDEDIYRQYQLYSLHGQSKDAFQKMQAGSWEYDILGPWYKCNMTDILAALGLAQLKRYGEMLNLRRQYIQMYDDSFDDMGVFHLIHYGSDYSSSGHLYIIRINSSKEEDRNAVIQQLADEGIFTNVHFKPLPMMTAYKNMGWSINDFPNAYDYYKNAITLPLYTKLSCDDVEYVISTVKKVLHNKKLLG